MTALTRRTLFASGAGLAAVTLAACGARGGAAQGPEEENGVTEIAIGASPKPHAEILKFVQDNLAKDAGLNLKITQYTDYQIPNQALNDGDIDANFYQTPNFLKQQEEEKGYDFFAFEGVHIEPMGLYSNSLTSLEEVPDGAKVAIANDPANTGRGLGLLQSSGLITLKEGVDVAQATPADVAENPKNLTFTTLEAAQIARSLDDFALGAVNGNYALEAGFNPKEQALFLEPGENSPYANLVVCREADKDNAGLKKLDELLHSEEVKKFITETYTDGSVIPAF
ncbi:MetQ/NlpA family ABC transporter substrate-binding protein [Brachybacterium sp. EF45031]|uniref:MetQ/NlpA family ABC transporter substrate-binding protein n=1 Tax=Brachybacterium sillae TaxID=2810536 RepID=UPI00217DA901|nr:MetQ/NlpA family ABC transporter substrate-binding protein [Brachybacterium sillae]MCS6711556.1 MetQ/NlpA family ABC transporter substrate-binding protein [Brachybacterium sillae]